MKESLLLKHCSNRVGRDQAFNRRRGPLLDVKRLSAQQKERFFIRGVEEVPL